MNNTSSVEGDNFELIAEDTMDLLVKALAAIHEDDRVTQLLASLEISSKASEICTRAIALVGRP